jgi:hypothetical protein
VAINHSKEKNAMWGRHQRDDSKLLIGQRFRERAGKEPIDDEKMRRLYLDEQLSMTQVGERLGCDRRAAKRHLVMMGVQIRPLGFYTQGERNSFYNQHHTEETRENLREQHLGVPLSAEHRAKIGQGGKGHWAGKKNPMYGKKGAACYRYGKPPAHGKGNWYVNGDRRIWMRSTFEIRAARALDQRGIAWEYEPRRFELQDRTYTPDFYLPDMGVWYEIKGWFHERHQETIRQFRELYPEEPLIVVTKQVLQALERGPGR